MKKYFEKVFVTSISILTLMILSACGHSLYHKVEGTGIYGRIPTPNGGSLIEIALGDMSITSGILRGGATLDEHTSKGGTFGSVSLAKHTHITTVPAMNEGYLRDVFVSPDTDDVTKQKVAEYLITRQPIPVPSAAVTSVNSASATGEKDKIPAAQPTKIGWDNVVDKSAETIKEVAPPVVETISTNTAETIQKVSGDIESGVTTTSDSFFDKVKSIWVWIIAGIIIIIIIGEILYFYFKHKKQKNENTNTPSPIEED